MQSAECGEFQCSSASRKFLNRPRRSPRPAAAAGFQCSSASRKFLNLWGKQSPAPYTRGFQCSSASRKFLNLAYTSDCEAPEPFQCSSASRKFLNVDVTIVVTICKTEVSVLFSEPKIPQYWSSARSHSPPSSVSVLFSEPKIPQFALRLCQWVRKWLQFQCSSASRKFLNSRCSTRTLFYVAGVSVLFSEPKIPQ